MTKSSWLAFVPLILFIALIAAFALALKHSDPQATKFAQHVNEAAPATMLPLLNKPSAHFAIKEWLGRPYIINFFASWCVPCRSEHETLLDMAHAGIPIIGIAFEDKPEALTAFLGKHGNPYLATADDSSGRTGIDWGLTGVPETFIIDARGVIRFHTAEPITQRILDTEVLPIWNEVKG